VLINLLSNAIQAMPQGGALRLRTQDQPDAQGRAGVLNQTCCEVGAVHSRQMRTVCSVRSGSCVSPQRAPLSSVRK
jgi:signal transduction histidine kinase